MSIFCWCPICGGPLERGPSAYSCPAGTASTWPGRAMSTCCPPTGCTRKCPATTRAWPPPGGPFLSKDYYAPCGTPCAASPWPIPDPAPSVLDTGCGEGYYTSGVPGPAPGGRSVTMAGTDISKAILRRAAKREKDVEFAVASSYHLPVADGAVDLLVNCFSPWPSRSSAGCCGPAAYSFMWCRRKSTCGELKQVLYDRPYPNEVKQTPYPGFRTGRSAMWRP